MTVQGREVVTADGVSHDLPAELADVLETGELDEVEVHLFFKGGEMWAAVNVLAREAAIPMPTALASVLAVGLTALGYEVPFPMW